MTYAESEKKLNQLRENDEILFRMAISHLMDVGIRHLTEELVESTCASIMQEDDTNAFITNRYKCALVRLTAELAKIDHIHLLVYITENIEYDVGQTKYPIPDSKVVSDQFVIETLIDWMDKGFEHRSTGRIMERAYNQIIDLD